MTNEARLLTALAFAADKHRNQRRKDREASPYINHPIAVARILAVEGSVNDPITLAAAILHDTIEDTKTTPDELQLIFGEEITSIVLEVTDDKALSPPERKRLQVEHAPRLSKRAKLVKLADKISNLRDLVSSPPHDWELERKQRYFDWARDVIEGLRVTHPRLEAIFDETFRARP
jgi:guanosine-3',5'-bis(diphosphate) 3'-pyrophosphohydrolase